VEQASLKCNNGCATFCATTKNKNAMQANIQARQGGQDKQSKSA